MPNPPAPGGFICRLPEPRPCPWLSVPKQLPSRSALGHGCRDQERWDTRVASCLGRVAFPGRAHPGFLPAPAPLRAAALFAAVTLFLVVLSKR